MFKKIIVTLAILLSTTGLSAADMKIGVVDVKLVLSKAPQMKAIGDRVQAQYKSQVDALSALQKKGLGIQEKLKRDALTLTNQQKVDMQRELQTIDNDLKLKQGFLQQDMKMASAKEQNAFLKKIDDAIKKIAKEGGFDMILNREAVPFVDAKHDISDKVIKIISNPAS
jgi:outer membrane protein